MASMDYGPMPQNQEEAIKKYFEKVLFDPYSAHYDFQEPEMFWYKQPPLAGGGLFSGWIVRVSANAKNRFGGYVGAETSGFLIKNEEIIKVLSPMELQNIRHSH